MFTRDAKKMFHANKVASKCWPIIKLNESVYINIYTIVTGVRDGQISWAIVILLKPKNIPKRAHHILIVASDKSLNTGIDDLNI